MMPFSQHGTLTIHTVNPSLKTSGSGAYPVVWALDIFARIEGMGHGGRGRASYNKLDHGT